MKEGNGDGDGKKTGIFVTCFQGVFILLWAGIIYQLFKEIYVSILSSFMLRDKK